MRALSEPVILSVSGPDRPGILAELAGILARGGIDLVDIEQATLQNFLALSFLIDLGGDPVAAQVVLRDFLSAASRLGLATDTRFPSQEEIRSLKEQDLWALTVLGSAESASIVAAVAEVTSRHGANIVSIRRLAEEDLRAAEFLLDAARVADVPALRRDLFSTCEAAGADVGLAPEDVHRKSKRMVIFDADSTLVAGEVIDELARAAGSAERVADITRRAMEGELDFAASLTERVATLAGLETSELERIAEALPLTPGADAAIAALKRLGYKVGVISGGFTFFTDHLKERLGLDYAFGNELEIEGGRLTGRVVPPILDAAAKAQHVKLIASLERVPLSQVVAVGDGANDIPMLTIAGLGVAFRGKEATRRAADGSIHRNDFEALLYLLGISHRDLKRFQNRGAPTA